MVMEINKGDLVVLKYNNRSYSYFVKRIEGDIVVCSEQFAPQYNQEVFIHASSFSSGKAQLFKQILFDK